ncbi:MAG: HNH endonuclease [Chloroflexi bacterium]|nr:HNH endonuclease [Chloroflexota bacterium]
MPRKSLPIDVKRLVLHEAGYKCGNPVCRSILTLDIHHLERVSEGGPDSPDNLLALCPNCHALHHRGEIPIDSIRAWKMLLLTINEAFDRKTLDLLSTLSRVGLVYVTGDGLLSCAVLVAGGLVGATEWGHATFDNRYGWQTPKYQIRVTERGRRLLSAWRSGDQAGAIAATAGAEQGAPGDAPQAACP